MRRAAQTALVLIATGCALVLSGTATVALAAAAHVPGWAHLAAVGVIEVVLATGTWLWVTDAELRREAALAVVLASAVSAYAGLHAYGPFGLVGPGGALVTVHLVARAWRRPAPAPSNRLVQAQDLHRPESGPAPAVPAPTTSQSPVVDPPLEPSPPAEPELSDEDLVADLRQWIAERGRMPGRDAVKARYGVGSGKADKLREAAIEPQIRMVK